MLGQKESEDQSLGKARVSRLLMTTSDQPGPTTERKKQEGGIQRSKGQAKQMV